MRTYTTVSLRQKASEIIEQYKGSSTVQLLDALVNNEQFSKIEFESNKNNKHIKGAVIGNKTGKHIFIRSDIPTAEKLFIYAHEVSHILLHSGKDHMDFIAQPMLEDQQRSDMETEANALAYELLFPLAEFIESYKENNGDIKRIACHFNASIYRVRARLSFLRKQIALKRIDNFIAA